MCGILAAIAQGQDKLTDLQVSKFAEWLNLIIHRGPDGFGQVQRDDCILGHRRLSIMDVAHGSQPFESKYQGKDIVLVCNGEVYNHQELRQRLLTDGVDYPYTSHSDNEVIIPLYLKYGLDFLPMLNGMFGFVLYVDGNILAARDAVGIKPLLKGAKGDQVWFSSEIKALVPTCQSVEAVPAGHYWTLETGYVQYYNPSWHDTTDLPAHQPTSDGIYQAMEAAVKRRLMSDVPLGCFISGGLDSSLVAAYTRKLLGPDAELHSFSVAVEGADSGDRICSKKVSEHLNTIHHEAIFTVEEGIAQVIKTIYQLETFDATPLRSGVAMGFLCRLAAQHVKVCLTGEGADEVWAGYLYFGEAQTPREVQEECVRKIKELPNVFLQFDDRLGMGESLELRVPFLDTDLLEYAMNLDPASKMHIDGKMEKYILREATQDLLPEEIVWRRKEQFGDGIGYSWIDSLKAHWDKVISDEDFAMAASMFPDKTPATKEAFFYRQEYEKFFPLASARKLVIQWFPWSDPTNHESSGRKQKSHATNVEVMAM